MSKKVLLVITSDSVQRDISGNAMTFQGQPVSPEVAACLFCLGIPLPKSEAEMEAAIEKVIQFRKQVDIVKVDAKKLYNSSGKRDSKLLVDGMEEIAVYDDDEYAKNVTLKLNLSGLDRRFGKNAAGLNTWLYMSCNLGTFKGGAITSTGVEVLKDYCAKMDEYGIEAEPRVSDGKVYGYHYECFGYTYEGFDGKEHKFFPPHLTLQGTFFALIEQKEKGRYGKVAIKLRNADGTLIRKADGQVKRARGWGMINSHFNVHWAGSKASYGHSSSPAGINRELDVDFS